MPNLLEDLLRGAGAAMKGVGAKVLTRGLDSAFEDMETAANEALRRVQRARRKLKTIEKGENPKEADK
jgi:hypothetical protein